MVINARITACLDFAWGNNRIISGVKGRIEWPFLPPAYVVRREGNSFTLFVSSHLGGGVPVSHNALQHFPECHGAAGGYPARSSWGGGTLPGPAGGGVPWLGGYPGWGVTWLGGTLAGGVFWPGGYPGRGGTLAGGVPWPGGYPVRTTQGVLPTRRAVCLLRSRRTFLLTMFLKLIIG